MKNRDFFKAATFAILMIPAAPAACPADIVALQRLEQSGIPAQSTLVMFKLKGEKLRVDIGQDVSVIMDTRTGSTLTLRHPQKLALEVSAEAARQLWAQTEQWQKKNGEKRPPVGKLVPTGESAVIAGWPTRAFSLQTGTFRLTWWLASKPGEQGKQDLPAAQPEGKSKGKPASKPEQTASPEREHSAPASREHPERSDGLLPFAVICEQLQKTPLARLAGVLTSGGDGISLPEGVPLKTELQTPDGRKLTSTFLSAQEEPLSELDFKVPPGYHLEPGPVFSLPLHPLLPQ